MFRSAASSNGPYGIIPYEQKQATTTPQQEVLLENEHSYAMLSNNPVSKGCGLVIPKRHVASYFDLTINEQIACQLTLNRLKQIIDEKYAPDGYSVTISINALEGQGVEHVVVELVGRYEGVIKS